MVDLAFVAHQIHKRPEKQVYNYYSDENTKLTRNSVILLLWGINFLFKASDRLIQLELVSPLCSGKPDRCCELSCSWLGVKSRIVLSFSKFWFSFCPGFVFLNSYFAIGECVQHGGFLIYHMVFRPQIVFTHIFTFAVNIMSTEIAIFAIFG